MANQQAFCAQALVDMMNGKHALGPGPSVARSANTKDDYYGALYYATASRGQSDTVYTNTGEPPTGSGYTQGGALLTTATAPALQSLTSYWTPSASLVWTGLTIGTAFNCLLIYNFTSSAKLALSTHTFGNQTVTAGNFTLTMPINDGVSGLIRFTAAPAV